MFQWLSINISSITSTHCQSSETRGGSPEAAKLSKFDFTSHAPQQLQIFNRLPNNTSMLRIFLNKSQIELSKLELLASC